MLEPESWQVFSGIWLHVKMGSWTFLTNRAPVLLCVAHDPDAPARHRGQPELRPRGKRAIGEILTLLTGSNTTET
jgi:hypothetical protein